MFLKPYVETVNQIGKTMVSWTTLQLRTILIKNTIKIIEREIQRSYSKTYNQQRTNIQNILKTPINQ